MSKLLAPVLAVVAVASIVGNVMQYERFSTRKPVITVGNQAISKYEYQSALETAAGAPILKKMVYTDLVRQAAAKAGATPTRADVDARIADLQRRAPQAATQAANPATAKQFREDLTTDMALENLRIQGVTASDAEIAAFYARNKGAFASPGQVQTTMVVSEHAADAATAEHLLQQNVKAETIAGQPRLHVAGINGFNINMAALPPDVRGQVGRTVLAMKPGQIKTLPILGKYFLTFKFRKAQVTSIPPLAGIRDQVTRQVKLQKAVSPQAELATLYAGNPPTFNVQRYQALFSDVQSYNAQKKTASAR